MPPINKEHVEQMLDIAGYLLLGVVGWMVAQKLTSQQDQLTGLREYVEKVERDFIMWESAAKSSATSSVNHAEKPVSDM